MADNVEDVVLATLRADQLEEWFDHLDEVFEATPRQYFVLHWLHDESPDLEGIRVALDAGTGKIVSTVRVYLRQMYWDGQVVPVGGIGEVSTKKPWRGKGLASKLLQEGLSYMRARGLSASSLHTGAAAPVYAKLGWVGVPRELVIRPLAEVRSEAAVATLASAGLDASDSVFAADLLDQRFVMAVSALHAQYAPRFNGTFVRSLKYWQQWIANEPHLPLAVGKRLPDGGFALEAYASFAPKKRDEGRLLLKDFCVSSRLFDRDRGCVVFLLLLDRYLVEFRGRITGESTEKTREFSELVYPAAPFRGTSLDANLGPECRQTDSGTMYRAEAPDLQSAFVNTDSSKHLFWHIDSF